MMRTNQLTRRRFMFSAASLALAQAAQSSPTAQEINWVPFLGPSDLTARDKFSPRYGIRYNARGFDHGRRKRIDRKTPNYLIKKGAPHLIEDFQMVGNLIVADAGPSGYIPFEIDLAFEETINRWLACGGSYAGAARRFDPRSLYIQFEDRPFWSSEHGLWANGRTDGQLIEVVIITADRLFSNPKQASLKRFEDLLRWETGNALALFAGIPYTGIASEIGNQSPCAPRFEMGIEGQGMTGRAIL